MPLVLGIDCSASFTSVQARDADNGVLVAAGEANHPPVLRGDVGVAEQDPAVWWDAFGAAWAAAGSPRAAAVAVAAQGQGIIALDVSRRVIRPGILSTDTRAKPDAGWLTSQLPAGAAGWSEACGTVPDATFSVAKLSWLHRSEPDAWARLASVCLAPDWLTMQLCGEAVTDRGVASGTGYWSVSQERYRFDLLDIVDGTRDWASMVPPVFGPLDAPGRWDEALVAPGTGRTMAAALGTALQPGDVAVFLDGSESPGDTATICCVAEHPTADPSGTVRGFADATGRYLPTVQGARGATAAATAQSLLGSIGTLGHHARLDGRLRVHGGTRAECRALADRWGKPIIATDGDGVVVAGACVAAAALLHRRGPDEIGTAWGLGAGTVIEPR